MTKESTTIFDDDETASSKITREDSPETIIGNIRRTLAEYEKKMLEKEALENADEPDPTSWGHFLDIPEKGQANILEHPESVLKGSTGASLRDSAEAERMVEVVEYSAVESIPLDESMLKDLYGIEGDDDNEEKDDDADKPAPETSD